MPASSRSLLHLLLFRRKRFRLLVIGLSLGATCTSLLGPYFQKVFIDRILHAGHGGGELELPTLAHWPILTFIGLAFVCAVTGQLLNLLAIYSATREGVDIQREVSNRMYRRMLNLRTDTLAQKPVGEVVSIYASDAQGTSILLEQSLPQLASIFFPLVLAPLAMTWLYHVPLTLTLLVMGAVIVLNTTLAIRQSRFFYLFKQLAADRTGLVNEWVQNIRTLRILGWMSDFEKKIFRKRREETHNRIGMVTNGQFMNAVASSVTYGINLSGLYSVIHFRPADVTPGELLALLWIFGIFLVRPFRQMPWFFTLSLDGLSSLRRLEDFIQQQDHGGSTFATTPPVPANQVTASTLDIENLNLTIEGTPILHHINLHIQSGEFVAIVGEVGAGKSLLLLSLMGETGATFDRYRIGSDEVRLWSADHLRAHFGYVPQEGFVMSATLRENIAFDYDIATTGDHTLSARLKVAQFNAQHEVRGGGLDAEIGERGVNLSGGQRQRVSLARAAFYDRPIILLDDSLSAVDVDTERGLVADLLLGQWRQRTRILVTHRLSVLEKVDRVIFMRQGQIVDEGRFVDLIQRSSEFRHFTSTILSAEVLDGTVEVLAEKLNE
jgi:ABC-type multidrug transport system fused ATPase/permease subunit